jgi:VWFA-related protein
MRLRVASLISGLAAIAGAQEAPTIRVLVRLVTVPAMVLSGEGRVIEGLGAPDFEVLDNGRRQIVSVDRAASPLSVVIAVQANSDVRRYLPSIAKAAGVFEDLLVGATGEAAVIAYGSEIKVIKEFGEGNVRASIARLAPQGDRARVADAGMDAVRQLSKREPGRNRVLILIGQPADRGSTYSIEYLRMKAVQANVSVFAVILPVVGKSFVAGTFRPQKIAGAERGGFKLGMDFNYGRVLSAAKQAAALTINTDPFSRLTAATGGTQFSFRDQIELENAIAAIGVELRSLYTLNFYATGAEPGYHKLEVRVRTPDARVFVRPGYWGAGD